MRHGRTDTPRRALAAYCAVAVLLAGAYASATLAAIVALPCEYSLDPQRFCVWWGHSALPTLAGVPAVLGLGCYASLSTRSRRPVTLAAALVVLVCVGLREAAVQEFHV
jgi:hypothetical protein